jgi:hypothetical protein
MPLTLLPRMTMLLAAVPVRVTAFTTKNSSISVVAGLDSVTPDQSLPEISTFSNCVRLPIT